MTISFGSPLPTNPKFDSVTATRFIGDNKVLILQADQTLVLQDENGDYAYWDRNQGLQLVGQGDVTSRLTGKNIEVRSDSVVFKNEQGSQTLATLNKGQQTDLALKSDIALLDIDSIADGLTANIKAASSPVRAIHVLTDALVGFPFLQGIVNIDTTDKNLGLFTPNGGTGYGLLTFQYSGGSVNNTAMQWYDENGSIYHSVNSAQSWSNWKQIGSTLYQASFVNDEIFIEELNVNVGE